MTAAVTWAETLGQWGIPDRIRALAPQDPWIHPVQAFTPPADIPDSPSHALAREALPEGGTVLDVGSGGGIASLALVPPAAGIVAVDNQPGMLEVVAREAQGRGVTCRGVLGTWPDVAAEVPPCDVVVCHNVAYNVADIAPFLAALADHARHRVVVQVPMRHPLSSLSPLWKRFWDLDRPMEPSAELLLQCALDAGLPAHLETWQDDAPRPAVPRAQEIAMTRVRLCLPADRDAEIGEALDELGPPPARLQATLWWDRA